MSQVERNKVITAFKNKSTPILAATDVAGTIHNNVLDRFRFRLSQEDHEK